LQQNGCDIFIPPEQGCCGAIHYHAGDSRGARRMADANLVAFELDRYDAIVVNHGGCGAMMKEYGLHWRDGLQPHREKFAAKVKDVHELLDELGLVPPSGRIDVFFSVNRKTGFMLLDTLIMGDMKMFVNALWHMILPTFVLSTTIMPILIRITRASMLEVLNQDYVRTARAKGLTEKVVITLHALKNALLPIVTVIGGQLGGLLGGAILTETVFSWPGMGTWMYRAILSRDYPIVQSAVLVSAMIYVFVNLGVDILYAVIDPRVRFEKKK